MVARSFYDSSEASLNCDGHCICLAPSDCKTFLKLHKHDMYLSADEGERAFLVVVVLVRSSSCTGTDAPVRTGPIDTREVITKHTCTSTGAWYYCLYRCVDRPHGQPPYCWRNQPQEKPRNKKQQTLFSGTLSF
jgi:hypothetical protein